jgi:2-phospho-L-lactate guanylyltransferase
MIPLADHFEGREMALCRGIEYVPNIWAIVPLKSLNRSKSRLSPVLSIEQREALSREMFERTLKTLKQVKRITGILVVSRDAAMLALARSYKVQTLQENGAPELNASLTRATQVVLDLKADSVLIVAGDIPLLQTNDIEAILELADDTPAMVIATDRRREGTNVMLVHPPGLFPYSYGKDSRLKHIAAARQAGATIHLYDSPTSALDVDRQEDLDLYRERLLEEK